MFTLYHADVLGSPSNCSYPHQITVTDLASLQSAVTRDYVCAAYQNHYRSGENFISADCLPVDCDNDHSDSSDDWVTPADVSAAFPGVRFAVHYSRSHRKVKNGRAARPKFHVLFPIDTISDPLRYSEMKKEVQAIFPHVDAKALDAARFFFGTKEPQVEIHEGSRTLSDFLEEDFDADLSPGDQMIPEGSRNATLSHYAGRIVVRLGATDNAYDLYLRKAALCDPPLAEEELDTIWQSAKRFGEKVSQQEGYIPPEDYGSSFLLKPPDYSDIGQAKIFVAQYGEVLKFTPATDFIRYDGICWIESKERAVGAMEEFLDLQLEDAKAELAKAKAALLKAGVDEALIRAGGKALEKQMSDEQFTSFLVYQAALSYFSFVMKRRDMRYVLSALQAAKPMLEIEFRDLDKDPYLLNGPDGTYDLRKGMAGKREHRAGDFITKVTAVTPSDIGKSLWLDALARTFQNDAELIEYVQMLAGLGAIGQVQVEALLVSYGEGANGKSTLWNTIAAVLGSYSGTLSADALTTNVRRNVRPELAEIRGKRLLIAAELEEGTRLSTSIVKQLASTDLIKAEKKFKDPADFAPSHTLVLYTNHLPKVGASDAGIWRRLIVIPFLASIPKDSDVKNYSSYLVEYAGPYVLKWIIEGAKKAIDCNFKFPMPAVVEEAISKYRSDNDWLTHFLDECCDVAPNLNEQSGKLYEAYRTYCARTGEFTRSAIEFTTALEQRNFERVRRRDGRHILGLKLTMDDFL